ncbi:MAG TPA: class I SAM-dependent methyltransferase [Candidatus Omnitrophota bacterium]|nr:class I SAM-dependent methyltransferase [Candidatus Omnitrophota bacterium]
MTFKEYIYRLSSGFGIKLFSKIFPEYFASEPLAPSDRYLENYFAIKNIPKPPAKILDVGSSGCYFPLILAASGYDAFSIDIRPYPILKKLNFENFTFKQADICNSPFPDNYFDGITAISMIEHIGLEGRYGMREAEDADIIAVREMIRILKQDGTLILTVPCGQPMVIKPFHRIYDRRRIEQLAGGYLLPELFEYYLRDGNGDWSSCKQEEAESIDARKADCAICLVKLRKK